MTGFVYFVSSGAAVKIGFSTDPAKRFYGLQTSHPGKLVLLGSIPGSRDLERALHERFADRRRVGEWFRADEGFLEELDALLKNPPPVPPRRDRTRAKQEDEALAQRIQAYLRMRHPQNTASHVAAVTGLDDRTVFKWFERHSLPSGEALAQCIVGYGPTFLAALCDPVPRWIEELVLNERRSEILAEIHALFCELRELNEALDVRPATGPPEPLNAAAGEEAPVHQGGP